MPRTPHEPAPALAALLLDQMHAYEKWDLPPALYAVFTDKLMEIPIPPGLLREHPRGLLAKMARAFEESAGSMAPPPGMVGVAMMFEFWAFSTEDPAEREEWRKRNFAEHPRAYEMRALIAEQPGHPPVAVVHQRDSKGTGVELQYPVPTVQEEIMIPGMAAPPLLSNLNRIMRAMCAPPATFRAR